ncbi:MAG: phosphatase family protein [Parcubacteria group bacterium]|nr:phosphatase family protein [Parcubacteria group bacterium]
MHWFFEWLRIKPTGYGVIRLLVLTFGLDYLYTYSAATFLSRCGMKFKSNGLALVDLWFESRIDFCGTLVWYATLEEFKYRLLPIGILVGFHASPRVLMTGIIVSSMWFGLIHGKPSHLLIQGIGGLLYSIVFLKCGGVEGRIFFPFACVCALHYAWNGLVFGKIIHKTARKRRSFSYATIYNMNTLYIFGAKYLFVLSPLLGLWWFVKLPKERRKRVFIFGLLTLPLAFILAKTASHFYMNPRPFVVDHFTPLIPHAADNGFPSDHTLFVSAIAAVVTFFNRRLALLFWLVAIAVAVSRVAVGVHHPIDVTFSAIIAAVSAYIVHFFLKCYNRHNAERK